MSTQKCYHSSYSLFTPFMGGAVRPGFRLFARLFFSPEGPQRGVGCLAMGFCPCRSVDLCVWVAYRLKSVRAEAVVTSATSSRLMPLRSAMRCAIIGM